MDPLVAAKIGDVIAIGMAEDEPVCSVNVCDKEVKSKPY